MARTNTLIKFGLYDMSAKEDALLSSQDTSSFSHLSDVVEKDSGVSNYATLEKDVFRLDGSMFPFPLKEPSDVRFWSKELSDVNGRFKKNPNILIQFDETHTSTGITLSFCNDSTPSEMTIKWLLGTAVLSEKSFYPTTDGPFFCQNQVENYDRLEITFIKTQIFNRYVKLKTIIFGEEISWKDNEVLDAKLNEEINAISTELSINTLDFTIYDASEEFNIINPKGIFKSFQKTQEVEVIQEAGNKQIPMGTFYLESWKSDSEAKISFSCIDLIGILDKTDFKDGRIYMNEKAENIINAIMKSANCTKYVIQEDIKPLRLSGWLPISTHRIALQQVAIALGAVIDTSRDGLIKIFLPEENIKSILPLSRKFMGSSITVSDFVSDVNVTAHSYYLGDVEEINKATYRVGTYEILFTEPCDDLSIEGAVIVKSNTNYAIIEVMGEREVILSGCKYKDNPSVVNRSIRSLPAGSFRNAIAVDSATLVTGLNVSDVADKVFNYYQLRQQQEIRFIPDKETVNEFVMIESQFKQLTSGVIQKMSFDLTGGFIASVSVKGANEHTKDVYYTGELYAGEEVGNV